MTRKKLRIKKSAGSKPQLPKGEYAFIIGNGTSRKNLDVQQLMDYGLLFGCNWFFKNEFRPHVLVSSDEPLTQSIYKNYKNYPMRNWFYSWYPKPGTGAKKCTTPEKFAAGIMATHVACDMYDAPKVFLIGMDFFGFGSNGTEQNGEINNLYINEKHYAKKAEGESVTAPTYRNWQRRLQWILKKFPDTQFYHVNPFEGKSPERLVGAPNWHQISFENLMAHINHDAELVDIRNITEADTDLFFAENPDDIRATLERQISGQENVIFDDLIEPVEILKLRLAAAKEQRKNPNATLTVKIGDHDCLIPGSFVKDQAGNVMVPTDDMIRKNWEIEVRERYKGKYTPPVETMGMRPPPPPSGLAPPPPPSKPSFEGLAPPPPPV